MTFIRNFIFAHVASCVNSELSVRLFRHLVHLPLGYFGDRQTGEIIARVRELDHIRNFLTGSALMMVLDLAFVGVFLAVMYGYAPQLATITLISLFVFVALWMCVAPLLRVRVEQEYERNAENTAFLTEAVTGIETIKSLGYNARFRNDWEERLASQLKASFRSAMIGNWAGGGIGLIQKIFSALILWFGVHLVLDGELSVGQLVAFNMLSGHVTMPILRLAQIWQDFQHTGISIKRIGDILNERSENAAGAAKATLAKVQGSIELRKVTFRYSDEGREVLRRLDLKIEAGQKLGITGLSGSGKSTITKLVQRLYVPQSGQILVDGTDLAMVDPSTLRRQIGVVLQENFLFNGSISENILIANPSATQADVERVCHAAGASSFIEDLQYGYDTPVGERGGNLSGGQRQRIAIARALISDPAILIFDEATSALDYESEATIIKQLPEILKGRTALMIAHRLNSMQTCDRIIVMEKGEIIEDGTHDSLLSLDNGRYAQLWTLQTAGHRVKDESAVNTEEERGSDSTD
jgi:ATP-binding cassette subfamily B protein RtxE